VTRRRRRPERATSAFRPRGWTVASSGAERLEQEATVGPSDDQSHAKFTHSAVFAEVKIDEELGVIRVTRVVSAVAAGRIINPKTAGSQILGAVVGGIGMALHEEPSSTTRSAVR
jgi:xanthine dehydrogenase YagR molybdenum-binding subunit